MVAATSVSTVPIISLTAYRFSSILGAVATVTFHPMFIRQLRELNAVAATDDLCMDLLADVSALIGALEKYGHEIEGYQPDDASHPIVVSRFRLFALRRTPPTVYTPYAGHPPVLRIPYAWFDVEEGGEVAVVMLVGDKTRLGNRWYPRVVRQIEGTMIGEWHRRHPGHRVQVRRML